MSLYLPIVFVRTGRDVTATVATLDVSVTADSQSHAEAAISRALAKYLATHPRPAAPVLKMAAVSDDLPATVEIVGPAALLGRRKSALKAATARANGRKGGRPATRQCKRCGALKPDHSDFGRGRLRCPTIEGGYWTP